MTNINSVSSANPATKISSPPITASTQAVAKKQSQKTTGPEFDDVLKLSSAALEAYGGK